MRAGPGDAWLLPRQQMVLRPALSPIVEPVAKLGGQPVWLRDPFWPISSFLGKQMTFIGQFPVPGGAGAMAYLFVTEEDGTLGTWEPEDGENAPIVQPGGRVPSFLAGTPAPAGPSLWRRGKEWTERVPVEFHIDLTELGDVEARALEADIARQEAERAGTLRQTQMPMPDHGVVTPRSYVGGKPCFWQAQLRVPVGWRFFFQLDGGEGWGGEPYALNFGGGTGYSFLSEDLLEGRFYWDCV